MNLTDPNVKVVLFACFLALLAILYTHLKIRQCPSRPFSNGDEIKTVFYISMSSENHLCDMLHIKLIGIESRIRFCCLFQCHINEKELLFQKKDKFSNQNVSKIKVLQKQIEEIVNLQ